MGFSGILDGSVALVTGGSQGLGALFAAAGGEAMALALDVTSLASPDAAVAAVTERWGHLDILLSNAGVTAMTPLLDLDEGTWDRILDTNLKGAFLVGQAAVRAMVGNVAGRTTGWRPRDGRDSLLGPSA